MAKTVENWLSRWIDLRSLSLAPRTIESYRSLLRLHIAPSIGSRRLKDLKPKHISSFLADLLTSGRSRTAQLCYILLRAALSDAVLAAKIPSNPVLAVKPPRHRRSDPRWWSPDELRRFVLSSQNRPYALAWQLALCCGLRRGELAGLRWSDVDLDTGFLHIRNQRQRVGGRLVDAPPKSVSSKRDIPIPAGLIPLLNQQMLLHQAAELLTGSKPVYVVSPDGRPIPPEALNRALSTDIAAANIRPINLHGLRHSMATLAVSLGVNMRVLQELLGHSSYAVTAGTYAHVLHKDQSIAMDKISCSVL